MSGLKLKIVEERPRYPLGRTIIKVIGAGGGGCNALNHMLESGIKGVEFIALNTDMQALESCKAPTKLALGQNLTGGLGAGGNPDIGARAAQEDKAVLEQYVQGAHMVFLTTGLGGGTGTGSLPILAETAKKSGALTVAIVTLPFNVEGPRKMDIARSGLEDLRKHTDALIVIPNEKLLAIGDRKMRITEAFAKANELLRVGVQGVVDLINNTGYINVDFADVKTVMSFQGEAIMGQGVGRGDNRAIEALKQALSCPLAENTEIDGAKGLLVSITAGDDLGVSEYDEVMAYLAERIDTHAVRKMGICIDQNMHDEVLITVIATGFDHQNKTINITNHLKKNKDLHSLNEEKYQVSSIIENNLHTENMRSIKNKTGIVSTDSWEKLVNSRSRNHKTAAQLDESIPSYLRMQNDAQK